MFPRRRLQRWRRLRRGLRRLRGPTGGGDRRLCGLGAPPGRLAGRGSRHRFGRLGRSARRKDRRRGPGGLGGRRRRGWGAAGRRAVERPAQLRQPQVGNQPRQLSGLRRGHVVGGIERAGLRNEVGGFDRRPPASRAAGGRRLRAARREGGKSGEPKLVRRTLRYGGEGARAVLCARRARFAQGGARGAAGAMSRRSPRGGARRRTPGTGAPSAVRSGMAMDRLRGGARRGLRAPFGAAGGSGGRWTVLCGRRPPRRPGRRFWGLDRGHRVHPGGGGLRDGAAVRLGGHAPRATGGGSSGHRDPAPGAHHGLRTIWGAALRAQHGP